MTRNFSLLLLLLLVCNTLFAQEPSDAERLANLSYMKYAEKVNCDSMSGTNLEHRVCLNLEFQRVDSILNTRFDNFIVDIENDSTKLQLIDFQQSWIVNRRRQSEVKSKGYRGHFLGIVYLDCMVKTTKMRIEELEYLMGMDEE